MNPVAPQENNPNPNAAPSRLPESVLLRNLNWFFYLLSAAGAALCLAWPHLYEFNSLNAHWADVLFMVAVTVALALNLARQLPLLNVGAAAGIILVVGGAAQLLGAQTSVPFGPFTFNREFDPLVFGLLPLGAPFLWLAILLAARGTARLILRPWRKMTTYGFWLIGVTAALVVITDVALEPFAAFAHHYWIWEKTKIPFTWYGAPVVNFLAWGFVALIMLAFATPLLINKQPNRKNVPDFAPFFLWLGMMIVFAAAPVEAGVWRAVTVDGVIAAVVTGLAVTGSRW